MAYQKVRKQRLLKVLDHIKAHPETWTQGVWDCETTACFCGWGLRMSKGFNRSNYNTDLIFYREAHLIDRIERLETLTKKLVPTVYKLIKSDGYWSGIHSYAQFGMFYFRIESTQAERLFHYANTIEDLERIIYNAILEEQKDVEQDKTQS